MQCPSGLAGVVVLLIASSAFGQSAVRPQLGLDTVTAEPAAPPWIRGSGPAQAIEPRLHVIGLPGPTQAAWIEGLSALGVRMLHYVPPHAYLVHASGDSLGAARQGLPIQWTAPFRTEWKIAPSLARTLVASPESALLEVIVQEFDVPGLPELSEVLAAAGHAPVSTSRFLNRRHLRARLPARLLAPVARWDAVYRIELFPMYELMGERSSVVSAGGLDPQSACVEPGYRAWLERKGLSGRGVIVQVTDDGVEQGDASGAPGTAHADLLGRLAGFDNPSSDAKADCTGGHGSINAGIIAGNAASGSRDGNGFLLGLGMAPEARIFGTKIFNNFGRFDVGQRTFTDLAQAAVEGGTVVSSNSWGAGAFGDYPADSAEYDALVRDSHPGPGDQPVVYVFSAGNLGELGEGGLYTLGSPATAKNVISVGAAESCDADGNDGCNVPPEGADSIRDLINFSSRGPCTDGRLAPTLVATGTHVNGPATSSPLYDGTSVCDQFWPEGQTLYARSSGTSHSCPQVAGAAALLHEHFQRLHGMPPSPALVKAALAASTRDLEGGQTGRGGSLDNIPSFHQGWGSLSLDDLFEEAGSERRTYFADNPLVLTDSGAEWEVFVFPRDPARPVRIALAWTDSAAIPGASPTLVNDLDLEVEADGQVFFGNVFAGGRSIPGGNPDRLNNLECVFIEPAPKFLRVRVRGYNLAGDGIPSLAGGADQDFALAAVNATNQSSTGVVSWRARSYGCAGGAELIASDKDLRGAGTLEVSIANASRAAETPLTLTETPSGSGVFSGLQRFGSDAGQLAVEHGDRIVARYRDSDDGTGKPAEATAEASIDCVAPQARNVRVAELTDNSALVTVELSEPARVTAQHGSSCDAARTTVGSRLLAVEHRIKIQGIAAGRKRYFKLSLEDAAGNSAIEDNAGRCYTFWTSQRVCSINEDLEPSAGPGWTHKALSGTDPWTLSADVPAHSPTHAWLALADTPLDAVLTTPELDVAPGDVFSFWHVPFLLSFESGAVLEVSTDGGSSWVDAGDSITSGGYTGELESGPLAGRRAWTGFPGTTDFSRVTVDLGRSSGPARRLRFRLAAGEAPPISIWVIDDIQSCHFLNKRGTIDVGADRAACEGSVGIVINDLDLQNAGVVPVKAFVEPGGAPLLVSLSEGAASKGTFSGELFLGAGEGRLGVKDGDSVVVAYDDADDGIQGVPVTVSARITIDCVPPAISGVRLLEIRATEATVSWETNEPTHGTAHAGDACGTAGVVQATRLAGTSHVVTLKGLTAGLPYFLRVEAADLAGNKTLEDRGGACIAFTPFLTCVAKWDSQQDFASWRSHSSEGTGGWRFGDFPQAHTPPACWFVDDPGQRTDRSLLSPPFAVTSDAYLSFWHTYELESFYDGGVIEASRDGGVTWEDLGPYIDQGAGYTGILSGENPLGSRPAWTGGIVGPMRNVTVALEAFAGSLIQVRFRMGSDSSSPGVGWYVDDIAVCRAIRERGSLSLSRPAFPCGAIVELEVRDTGLIGHGGATVRVTSTSEGEGEIVSLFESPLRSGVFAGSLPLVDADRPGALLARSGDTIQARYVDADDSSGAAREVLVAAAVDCEAPRIGEATVVEIAEDSATIAWRTEEPAQGRVELGTACGTFPITADDPTPAAEHSLRINGLQPATSYSFRIAATDLAGNSSILDNGGACFKFRTHVLACPFDDRLEPAANEEWTAAGGVWRLVTSQLARSRTHAWAIGPGMGPRDGVLVSPALEPIEGSLLEIWHTFELDGFQSGGFLEASSDGGETWEDLGERIVEGGYSDDILVSFEPPEVRRGWTRGAAGIMTRVRVALGDFAGMRVHIRLRYITQGFFDVEDKWLSDDFRMCTSAGRDGAVYFSSPAYGCEEPVFVFVADSNAVEPVSVELTSSSQAKPEVLKLLPFSPGLYRGNIAIFNAPVPGLLFALDGDAIHAVYRDPDGEAGGPAAAEGHARVDCAPPDVLDVRAEQAAGASVLVSWTTSEPARCELEAVPACATAGVKLPSQRLGAFHEVLLRGLEPGTPQLFKIHCTDSAGNTATADKGGACFSVELSAACSFSDPLEPPVEGWTDKSDVGPDGWSLVTSPLARSKTHAWRGIAPDGELDASLYTPPFDVEPGVLFSFWHTFSFEESLDGGVLEVTVDGGKSWKDLGAHIVQGGYNGNLPAADFNIREGWTGGRQGKLEQVAVDLSEFAGPGRKVRFRTLCDPSFGGTGWLVDDISLCKFSLGGGVKQFARGNCAADDKLNLTDAVFLLNHLFLGGSTPVCRRACDANADDAMDLSDAVHLLGFLFQGTQALPVPSACGAVVDPSPLDCEADACVGRP